jgi:hypothetical protein
MLDTFLVWCATLWPLPPLFRAFLAIGIAWALPYAVRRWLPSAWRRLEAMGPKSDNAARLFLSLPSVLAGALTTAITAGSGDPWRDTWMAGIGALAPFIHHFLKAQPGVPYEGPVRDQNWKTAQDVAAKHKAWEDALQAGGVDPTEGGDDAR